MMKSVFDKVTRDELVTRISTLSENSKAQWGKMNVYQMLRHCVVCDEMFLGKKKYKRALIGKIFGKMGLRNMLKNDKPFSHNSPTGKDFKIAEVTGDVAVEKSKWTALIEEYTYYSNDNFEHWFFGPMTKEQVGQFVYKHNDHHLRQFDC